MSRIAHHPQALHFCIRTHLAVNVEPLVGIDSDADLPCVSVGQQVHKTPSKVVENRRLVQVIEGAHIVHSLAVWRVRVLRANQSVAITRLV